MSNFKSGSGNLDFGGDGDDAEPEDDGAPATDQPDSPGEGPDDDTSESEPPSATTAADEAEPEGAASAQPEGEEPEATEQSTPADTSTPTAESSATEYPYFVRRNNVGDERDTRLEIHVREKVAEGEAAFRTELAEQLGTNEVSKTDAREFALLAAFRQPERVAELMAEEGFGTLD